MSTATQPGLFDPVPQPTWRPPKGAGACTRDIKAGPGTCWHWWEGCPSAERRGCYLLWNKQRRQT
jgi:hypothetical protein